MALAIKESGFINKGSSNKQTVCILVDYRNDLEPRKVEMIKSGISFYKEEITKDKSLRGRIDFEMIESENDSKMGFINAIHLLKKKRNEYKMKETGYFIPWIILVSDEINEDCLGDYQREILNKIENDELRVFSVIVDRKRDEYPYEFMNDGNCYYADASNRIEQAFSKILENMRMVSKSSERARIGYEKIFNSNMNWDMVAAEKKAKK